MVHNRDRENHLTAPDGCIQMGLWGGDLLLALLADLCETLVTGNEVHWCRNIEG